MGYCTSRKSVWVFDWANSVVRSVLMLLFTSHTDVWKLNLLTLESNVQIKQIYWKDHEVMTSLLGQMEHAVKELLTLCLQLYSIMLSCSPVISLLSKEHGVKCVFLLWIMWDIYLQWCGETLLMITVTVTELLLCSITTFHLGPTQWWCLFSVGPVVRCGTRGPGGSQQV